MRQTLLSQAIATMVLGVAVPASIWAQPLELSTASGPTTGSGPSTAAVTSTFLQNTTGSTFTAFTPPTTITLSISNQQFPANPPASTFPGITFGSAVAGSTATQPGSTTISQVTNSIGTPSSTEYTSEPFATAGTGFSVTDNTSLRIFMDTYFLQGTALNGRPYFGDLTVTFSRPVLNPVLHFTGIGGAVTPTGSAQGFYGEFELSTASVAAGYSLTRLSGTGRFIVSATAITNSSTAPATVPASNTVYANQSTGNFGSGGSVRINSGGTPITSVTFRMYVRGDGGVGTAPQWATTTRAGEGFQLSASLGTYTVAGRVFNDANGLSDATVNGVTTSLPTGLFANLVDNAGNVYASSPVTAGTYSFSGVVGSDYTVVISTTAGVVGTTTGATPALPAGWAAVGENLGTASGNDGTANGALPITLGASTTELNVAEANFGIEQLPTAGAGTASGTNPGGTSLFSVPGTAFSSTTASSDPAPGAVTGIRITALPTGASSILINGTLYGTGGIAFPAGGVVVTAAGGQPAAGAILVDPTASGATTVTIPFRAVDAAGRESINVGNAVLSFSDLTISGTAYNDVDGGAINGTGLGTASGAQLYVNLVNAAGNVIATRTLPAGGTYSFGTADGLVVSQNYTVVLTTTLGSIGTTTGATSVLPAGWVSTAEGTGGSTGDATADGRIAISLTDVSVASQDFGIEQPPTAGSGVVNAAPNPGGTLQYAVPATAFSSTTASSDPTAVTAIRITAIPTGAITISINGTTYGPGFTTFPAGGISVPANTSGQPTQTITVDPTAAGVTQVSIPFRAVDAAGRESSNAGTAVINFVDLTISGTARLDADGGTITGTGLGTAGSTQLYANLVNPTTGFVLATQTLPAGGTYSFGNAAGVESNRTLNVVLTTTQGVVGTTTGATSTLPAGWVSTAEGAGATTGDGTPNGLQAVTLTTTSIADRDFGIERLPETDPRSTVITQPTANQFIPLDGTGSNPQVMTGSDPEDQPTSGSLSGRTVHITSLPTNGQLFYNGAQITVGQNGTTAPSTANPFVIASLNPSLLQLRVTGAGYTATSFTYAYVDLAGRADPSPATFSVSWSSPLPVQLADFRAVARGCNAVLEWEVSKEEGLLRYEVEYSADAAARFATIASIQPEGKARYSVDYAQPATNGYYRLKMTDRSGDVAYSATRQLRVECSPSAASVVAFPNPTRGVVTISGVASGSKIHVFDAQGRVVHTSVADASTHTINLGSLVPGTYTIGVNTGSAEAPRLRVVKE